MRFIWSAGGQHIVLVSPLQVVRLTDEPFSAAKGVKSPLTEEKIVEWLVGKKVLSIALQGRSCRPPLPRSLTGVASSEALLTAFSLPAAGNLHHSQYCDKLRSIVEFLGVRLSLDELTSIWEMQVNENPVQVENVHSILAAAASRFTPQHLDHLFTLIQQVCSHCTYTRVIVYINHACLFLTPLHFQIGR